MACKKWRVGYWRTLRQNARKLGVWRRVARIMKDVKKRVDEHGIDWLLELPVTHYVRVGGKNVPVRRIKSGKLRIFFMVSRGTCYVWFIDVYRRTESTYKRKRLRP